MSLDKVAWPRRSVLALKKAPQIRAAEKLKEAPFTADEGSSCSENSQTSHMRATSHSVGCFSKRRRAFWSCGSNRRMSRAREASELPLWLSPANS